MRRRPLAVGRSGHVRKRKKKCCIPELVITLGKCVMKDIAIREGNVVSERLLIPISESNAI